MEKKQENDSEGVEGDDKKHTYLRREFSYSSFQQRMILPDNVNMDNIEAQVEHGVLTITIPKKTEEEKQKSMRQVQIR